jgi:hypothetical protein
MKYKLGRHKDQQNLKGFVRTEKRRKPKMEIEMSQKSEFEKPRIEEGLYPARLKEIKDISAGEYGDRVVLIFQVDKEKVDLSMIAYKKISPGTKLGQAFLALGAEIVDGKLDTEGYVGKECKIMVEDYEDKDGDTRSGVTKVKPVTETTEEQV